MYRFPCYYERWKNIYTRRLGKNLLLNKQEIEYPLYRVGSITKMFTAVLIYQEIEKGRLKLEDKLSDYFPEIPRAGDITIYQCWNIRPDWETML